jgi:hypothetical protein
MHSGAFGAGLVWVRARNGKDVRTRPEVAPGALAFGSSR